jgi:hypothetical protein
VKLEGITGIRNQGSVQQLRLRKERTTCNSVRGWSWRQQPHLESRTTLIKTFRETLALQITNRIAGTSIRLQKTSTRTS